MKPSLESVFEHYGAPSTRKRMTLCLLHSDTVPSCSVDWDKGLWHCHVCGVGGDSLTLVMKREGVDYRGALALVESWGLEGVAAEPELSRWGAPIRSRTKRGERRKFRPGFRRPT